jgi:hypothetical protein
VPWARATFSTKEKTRCAIVMEASSNGGAGGEAGGEAPDALAFVAEPCSFYRLPGGVPPLAPVALRRSSSSMGCAGRAREPLTLPALRRL